MAPASTTSQKPDTKNKKHNSRASSTSKVEAETSELGVNGTEPAYLKELQKWVLRSHRVLGKTKLIALLGASATR